MKPKKKSTSHVTELKKRVKAKILGKGEAPSSTSQTKIPQGTDAPRVDWPPLLTAEQLEKYKECLHGEIHIPPCTEGSLTKEQQFFTETDPAKWTLAQNVLSRLTSKCPSSPTVIPKGTPIK